MRRIYVTGTSPAAALLTEHLAATAGVCLVTALPQRTIRIDAGDLLAIDSIDSPLERHVEAQLEEIASNHQTGPWVKHRVGGNRDPRAMVITTPDLHAEHVARAIYFALLKEMGHGRRRWWRRALGLAALLLLAAPAAAQDLGTTRSTVKVTFTAPQHVICDTGCSGSGGGATTATGPLALDGETVSLTSLNASAVTVTTDNDGTADGSLFAEVSGDGTKWEFANCFEQNNITGGSVGSFETPGLYSCNVAGMHAFRIRDVGGTTGTFTVTLRATIGENITQAWVINNSLTVGSISNPVIVKLRDGSNNLLPSNTVDPATTDRGLIVRALNTTGSNFHIVCDSGCGSPPATADNSAFTFGTTSVSPVGFVVDDTATNAVTENSFGAPRMTGNRIAYADLSKSASNSNSFKVDFGGAAQPVSGTFWQATQPVSGTVGVSNFPATQAVSQSGTWTILGTGGIGSTAPTSAVYVGMSSSATGNLIGIPNATATPGASNAGIVVREAARGQGAMTASMPVVIASDQSAVPVSGTVTANAGTGTFGVNQTQVNGVAVSVNNGVSDTGTQRSVLAQEATYAAGLTVKTATAAGTAPFFSLCGSGTKTVRVQRFSVSGTVATAAVWGDVILKKTSTATSGGTATTLTAGPYDTNSAAATAVAKYYTVLATTAGTMVNVVLAVTQLFPITAISTTLQPNPAPIIYLWRDQDAEAPTLRGTGECLTANFGTTTTNAPTLTVSVAWTEK